MKVSQLIEQLQALPGDLEVVFLVNEEHIETYSTTVERVAVTTDPDGAQVAQLRDGSPTFAEMIEGLRTTV
jgi:hypothetical protein